MYLRTPTCRGFLPIAALIFFCQIIELHAPIHGYSSQTQVDAVSREQGHPHLYFSAHDIPRLRFQANTSHAGLYEKLVEIARAADGVTPPDNWEEFSAKWNVVYGDTLAALALYCVLTPHDRQALALAKLYMKRLARLPSWRVKGKERDDIPVAHTLLGFVTALDFLHASFTRVEFARYVVKTRETCEELYESSITAWWGRSYIHNHVATNYVALATAAVVVRSYYPMEALTWQHRAVSALRDTMALLRLVVDGSFQEGASYGSYTSRSLTQFLYLAEIHFPQSYRDNNWVREHINFLLHSTLPGYQKTVGIADSSKGWAYGPESQLTFLENYVYRDGRAIWLANRIRAARSASKVKNILSHTQATLYTEFLFYNASLKESWPSNEPKLHVFSDWGVVTYGGATPAGNVYLSFKCGRLHGRAMNMLHMNKVPGFNPGHEQPDHGSFVFLAKDQAVITESFYAPKFTYLENVVMFGHSRKSSCSSPYQGQLGECGMWFNHKDNRTWNARGELVGYSRHDDIVFMSGDMTGWYDQSLGLQNVYRALVMLTPSILVVVDIIRLRAGSPTTHVSAFFHNVDLPFKKSKERLAGNPCTKVGRYSMCWAHHNSKIVRVSTRNNFKVKRLRYATNFINITSRCTGSLSSMAYVFHGPDDLLSDVKIFQTPRGDGIKINLKMNFKEYHITLSARHDNPRLRRTLLGSSGHGTLRVNTNTVDLGLNLSLCYVPQHRRTSLDVIKMDRSFVYPLAFYILLTSFLAIVCLQRHLQRRLRYHVYIRWTMIGVAIVWLTTFFLCFSSNSISLTLSGSLPSAFSSIMKNTTPENNGERTLGTTSPLVVIATGLPLNGAEIARELFTTNTDFVVLDVPSTDVVTPSGDWFSIKSIDLCEWPRENDASYMALSAKMAEFAEWWGQVLITPWKMRRNKSYNDYITLSNPLDAGGQYGTEIIKSEGALAFVHFRNPGWLFRVPWLNTRFLRNSLTPVLYLVRDPRSWIENMLQSEHSKTFFQQFDRALRGALRKHDHCKIPSEILDFRDIYEVGLRPHVILAYIWVAFVSYASKLADTLPSGQLRIVHFEDLISSPKQTSEDIYSCLRMPFPAAAEHRILQVTKSGVFELENYGVIDEHLKTWGKILNNEQVLEIERICGKVMRRIGYS